MSDTTSKTNDTSKDTIPKATKENVQEAVSSLASGEKDPMDLITGKLSENVEKTVSSLLDDLA